MNRGKIILIFFFCFGFSLVCFWWLCKPVCRRLMFIYCGWRGRGRRGVLFVFRPTFSPTVPSFLPWRRLLFSLTVVRNLACCHQTASVKGRRAKKNFSAQFSVFTCRDARGATFVLLLAFFFTTAWNSLLSFKQRLSKETELLGLSIKKSLTHYISVKFFFFCGKWVLSHVTQPSLTVLGNRLYAWWQWKHF